MNKAILTAVLIGFSLSAYATTNEIRVKAPIKVASEPDPFKDSPYYVDKPPPKPTSGDIYHGFVRGYGPAMQYWNPPNASTLPLFYFGKTYNSSTGYFTFASTLCLKNEQVLTLNYYVDNSLAYSINGSPLSTFLGNWVTNYKRPIAFPAGCSKVQLVGFNDGAAGVLAFNLLDSAGNIMFISDRETWTKLSPDSGDRSPKLYNY